MPTERSKQPDKKQLSINAKTAIIVAIGVVLIIVLLNVASKSKPADSLPSKTTTPKATISAPVTFTYNKSDLKIWPFKVNSVTTTCTTSDGDAITTIDSVKYGLTGREGIHSTLRGYGDIEDILDGPYKQGNN